MTKHRNKSPKSRSMSVEPTLSSVVIPKLDAWLDDLADAIPRVLKDADDEAVHDLRVALRRIRSLLRVVRPIFGDYYVKRIRNDMKKIASSSGSLRDEEVLKETIDALSLSEEQRKLLSPWLETRAARESSLRATMIRTLQSGALDAPQSQLRALIRLPLMPGRDKLARKFARKMVFAAHAQVETIRTDDMADVKGLHDLRIAYKRLRYSVEAFSPALAPELRAWGRVATKFQKILGDVHDQDVAIDVVRESKDMKPALRKAVLNALDRKRTEYCEQYLELAGFCPTHPSDSKNRSKRKSSVSNAQCASVSKVAPTKTAPTKTAPTKTAPTKTAPRRKSKSATRKS